MLSVRRLGNDHQRLVVVEQDATSKRPITRPSIVTPDRFGLEREVFAAQAVSDPHQFLNIPSVYVATDSDGATWALHTRNRENSINPEWVKVYEPVQLGVNPKSKLDAFQFRDRHGTLIMIEPDLWTFKIVVGARPTLTWKRDRMNWRRFYLFDEDLPVHLYRDKPIAWFEYGPTAYGGKVGDREHFDTSNLVPVTP